MPEDEQKQKHAATLSKLLKEGFWTLSVDEEQNIRTAAKWALFEIERLATENAEEVQRVADFAILFERSKLEEIRLRGKVNRLITDRLFPGSINDNDLKREVIE